MAEDDKTVDHSKPAEHGNGSKAGAAKAAGANQPPSGTPPSPAKIDAGAKPIERSSSNKPSSDAIPPGPRSDEVKSGSEWTASDDRGPLGRAAEGMEGAATPESRDPAMKSPSEPATRGATPMSSGAAATTKDPSAAAGADKTIAAKTGADKAVPGKTGATETGAAKPITAGGDIKGPGAAKSAAVPPVDAPASGSRPGSTATLPSSAAARPTARPDEAKRSLWPVAAALILGAVIGAGSAAFVYRGYADDGQPDPKLADLTARVDTLEKRPDPQAAIGNLKSSVAALDKQVGAMRPGKGGSAPQPQANSQPGPQAAAAAPSAADLDEMRKQLAALQAKFDEPKLTRDTKALADKIQALQSEIDATKSDATATRASVAAVQGQQKDIADRAMMPALAVVADSLVQQIDHGQPYATQVDALASLGADAAKVAVLRQNAAKGVPSARELEAKFEPLVLPITATATKAPANAGLGDRLKSGMLSIVSIRRADDTSGDDLPSRVARIKTALEHDNVAAAFETWSKLPPDAKAKAEAWGALVKTRVEAMDAARALQQDAIAALGSKKS